MGRIVAGGLLALWGGAVAIYGLVQPIDSSPYGAGQVAGVVVAACLGLGGFSLAVRGIVRAGEQSAGRNRLDDWEYARNRDLGRSRGGSGYDNSPATIALVLGIVLVLVTVTMCAILIGRKDRNKPDAEQAGTNGPADGHRFPRPAPEPPPTPPPAPPIVLPPPDWPPVEPVPVPVPPAAPALKPGLRETTPAGGAFATNDYREYRPDGAILTGFEVGFGKVFNTVIIAYLRPIWLTARGEEYGTAYGRSQTPTVIVKARDGYAVGGVVIAGGGALEGFALTFMKRGAKHLDPKDAYTSEWYGEPTRRPQPGNMRAGDGEFVVGLFGKRFNDKRGNNYDDGGAIATIGFVLWVKE